MKALHTLLIILWSTMAYSSVAYKFFEGKWQEEKRTYGKRSKMVTVKDAPNRLAYEFFEEGTYRKIFEDGKIKPGHIRIKSKSILFFLDKASGEASELDRTYSSFEVNATRFILKVKDTTIYLRKVDAFEYKQIEKVLNNNTAGEVLIDLTTMQGSWRRYKAVPPQATDNESWSIYHLTVEYSVSENRYFGKAQFVSKANGQHQCDVTIVPKKESNEFIITEEDTEGVESQGIKLKIKVIKCEDKEMILKQQEINYYYRKEEVQNEK